MATVEAKVSGSYYTPTKVARSLVNWVVRRPSDWLLDPSCGDGQFLALHPKSIGVEQDQQASIVASRRASGSVIHLEDFFIYAGKTHQRFDCAAGNPPFIRYQHFSGETRRRALMYCRQFGAMFSSLSASWAPFLVATASLLEPGGRMAFVVPAEIGHAPYAAPLLKFLTSSFSTVHLIAVQESVFPQLSQDVWLLYTEGYGQSTEHISLTAWNSFRTTTRPPAADVEVSVNEWEHWGCRLRPFLLPSGARQLYRRLAENSLAYRLGDVARIGIGYVTGANEFFHLRPSIAASHGIPDSLLLPTVRNGRVLPPDTVSRATVSKWLRGDESCLLLRLKAGDPIPKPVRIYLDSDSGYEARKSYKCSHRNPWYVVPDVIIPDGFLSYMSGDGPAFVANLTSCTCTNSVHAVRVNKGFTIKQIKAAWNHPLTQLSAEIEGHPLGGGMLKLEPREATRILLPKPSLRLSKMELQQLETARSIYRSWRHYE